ncbi:hypothetical protein D3C75_389670 [compost metagenome]
MQQRLAGGIDAHMIEAAAELNRRAGREAALDDYVAESGARKAGYLLKLDAGVRIDIADYSRAASRDPDLAARFVQHHSGSG